MSLAVLSDESLLSFYENIRKQVEADHELRRRGGKHFFADHEAIKKYAANLRQEIDRRRLNCTPIVWL